MKRIKKIILVHIGDLLRCPPALNVVRSALDAGMEVSVVTTSDHQAIDYRESIGAECEIALIGPSYAFKEGAVKKLIGFRSLAQEFSRAIEERCDDNTLVWIASEPTIRHLFNQLEHYKYVLHLMELVDEVYVYQKARFIRIDMQGLADHALAVIVPTVDRAHIMRAIWNLRDLPLVFPNKPFDDLVLKDDDAVQEMQALREATKLNKKIILYQGIAHPERPLLPYLEAVKSLGSEYVFMTMGPEDPLSGINDSQYHYLGFLDPPRHLQVTRHAYIGVLSYFPVGNIMSRLNAVFCAPNKTFEYARFGIPMISNDVLGVQRIFEKYHCGLCVDSFDSASIADSVEKVRLEYTALSNGALCYYESTNVMAALAAILEKVNARWEKADIS